MKIRMDSPHLDAAENAFFGRELEHIVAGSFDVKYPELKARRLFPVDSMGGPGTDRITWRQYDHVGIAQFIHSYTDDLPRADVSGVEVSKKVHHLGLAFGYDIFEVKAAKKASRPLDAMKAAACRKGHEYKLEDIAFDGESALGLVGINGITNANEYTVPDGAAGGTDTKWTAKTPDEICDDLFAMEETPLANTNDIEFADTLLLPSSRFNYIRRKRMGDGSNETILSYFLKNSRNIKNVEPWYRLETAGASGVKRMLSYRRDPMALRLAITEDYNALPPEQRNLETVVNTTMSTGGLICFLPLSVTFADNI